MLYDLLIMGGGPAGYHAAEYAAKRGLHVALCEENALGGVCLNEGCIPTKTMLHSARLFDQANGGGVRYGVTSTAALDHAAVMARKVKVVRTLSAGVAAKMKAAGVEVVKARAQIAGKTGDGFAVTAGGAEYVAKRLLVCTGSEAFVPPVPGMAEAFASGFAATSREMLALDAVPEKLIVLGGGVIGLEMASYFLSAGSRVTVVEMLDHIGGPADPEMAKMLRDILKKRGMEFLLSTKAVGVGQGTLTVENAEGTHDIAADKLLVAVGRRARTAGLGLETVGVKLERGAVATDLHLRTSVPGIWAAGDVNGRSMLAHTASREAEIAVGDMLGGTDTMDYDAIPWVLYTDPEISGVGLSEAEAVARSLNCSTLKLPLRYSGRYVAENDGGNGFLKLTVAPDGRILGGSLIGTPGSEIIFGMTMAVSLELTCADLARVVFPHPTVGEVFREAALAYAVSRQR